MIKILAFFEHFLSRPHRIAPEYITPLQNVLRGQCKFMVELLHFFRCNNFMVVVGASSTQVLDTKSRSIREELPVTTTRN